jgi:AbrB family looped-hinge helix DNA binding protein
MFKTKITSQGTITLPTELRKKYNLQAGDTLSIEDVGKIVVRKVSNFLEIREKNKSVSKNPHTYTSGDGMVAHVREKYEKK